MRKAVRRFFADPARCPAVEDDLASTHTID